MRGRLRRVFIAAAMLLVLIAVPVASQLAAGNSAALRAHAAALRAHAHAAHAAHAPAASADSLVCALDDREPGSDGGPFKGEKFRTGADTTLVPRGATELTICSYNGMNATPSTPQFGLAGIGVSDNRTVLARLTRELDALKPLKKGAAISCPMDDDTQAILYFDYSSGPADVVTVGLNGCNAVTNAVRQTISYPAGVHPGLLALGAPVIRQIIAMTGPVKLRWSAVAGTVRIQTPVSRAVADNSSGFWVAMAPVYHHHFHFRIAMPGRYTVRLMGTGAAINRTVAELTTTVATGATTHVKFTAAAR